MPSGCAFQRAKRTGEPPAGGRGSAPLEVDGWPVSGERPPPAPPAGARKSTFILTPQRGGGVKVLLRYFLTEKVTKRLQSPALYGNMDVVAQRKKGGDFCGGYNRRHDRTRQHQSQ